MESSEPRRHFFDLKIPLGSLLGFYGLLLLVYGLVGPRDIYQKSANLDVNAIWGVIMILISAAFLLSAFFERRNRSNS